MAAVRSWFNITPVGSLRLNGAATVMAGVTANSVDLYNFGSNSVSDSSFISGAILLNNYSYLAVNAYASIYLSNGTEIRITKTYDGGNYWYALIELYDSNGNYIRDNGTGAGWSSTVRQDINFYFLILDFEDINTHIIYRSTGGYDTSNNHVDVNRPYTAFSEALGVPPVPIYHWRSIKSLNLAGPADLLPFSDPNAQSGIYTMLLSYIPDDYLNNGEPVSGGSHFKTKNPSLPEFMNKFNDTTYEYKNIYLKSKKYAKIGRRNAISYIAYSFTFYSAFGAPVQITYYSKNIDVASSDGIPYLGFIIDEENTAAKLNIIFLKSTYDSSTGLYNRVVDYNTISMTDNEMSQLYAWLKDDFGYDEDSENESENVTQGGDETDPVINEPLNRPTLPTKGAVKSGFIKLYEVTDTELQDVCEFMWDDSLITNLGRLFNDPREIIVGLMVFPIKPKPEDITANTAIYAGNLDTGVTGSLLKTEYRTRFAGEARIPKGNNDFMAFAPYRRIRIHIPYCGEHELDPSAVFGSTLKLYYHLSYFSGNCVAELTRTFEGSDTEEPIAFFGGQIGHSIPLSSEDFTRQISSLITAGAAVGTALCTYGAGMAGAIGAAKETTAGVMAAQAKMHAVGSGMMIGGRVFNGSLAPSVSYSSAGGATGGFLSSQQPYLIFDEPITAYDGSQKSYIGNTSYKIKKLGDCSGFTKCFEAHIESVHATESELNDIMDWLTNGVIIHKSGGSSKPSTTPTVEGNTVINFMKLSSEVNVIGKIWTNVTPIEGKLIYDQSITEPKILVNSSALEFNYCYIGLFNRFYFVKDIIARNADLIEIQLKSDPLQSFEDEIKLCYAAIERQSDKGNAFIDDSYKWTQINNDVCIRPFKEDGNNFDFAHTDDTYILTIAGV